MALELTAAGLAIQTEAEIRAAIEDAIRAETGIDTLQFGGDTLLGQLVAAFAGRESAIQDILQGLYDSFLITQAQGVPLSALVKIGGLTRKAATRSTVTVTALGVPATVIPAGTVFEVDGTGDRFATVAPATIGGGGIVDVLCEAQATGPIPAPIASLTVIVTPVVGLSAVANGAAAELGTDAESDPDLRLRYLQSFHLPGNGTVDAIRADLLDLEGVQQVAVYENTTMVIGGNGIAGMAAKSLWAIVKGTATAAEIAAVIWAGKPAGIEVWGAAAPGAVATVITDDQGFPHTVYHSTPINAPVDVTVTCTGDGATGPTAAVQAAISAVISALQIGDDVLHWAVLTAAAEAAKANGYDLTGITVVQRKNADAFVAANVAIAFNEIAVPDVLTVNFA